jgi:hypothetical protein
MAEVMEREKRNRKARRTRKAADDVDGSGCQPGRAINPPPAQEKFLTNKE